MRPALPRLMLVPRRRSDDAADSRPPGRIDAARLAWTGLAIVGGFFVFLGAWAALSPLDSAAVTYGVVGAEGERKVVQHLDGGVVRAILVKEGDYVKEGQEVLHLEQVQARATLEIQSAAVDTFSALIARLEAEAAGAAEIVFPAALLERTQPMLKDLIRSQEQVFAARRTAKLAQIGTLGEQIKQAQSQAAIYRGQVEIVERQYELINQELVPKQDLYAKGLGTIGPVLQLRRAATALLGQKQEYTGHIDRLDHSVGQLQSQITQIQSDHNLKVAQELEEGRGKLADAKERQRVAQDVLDRTTIRAPASGHVLGLNVHTVGGVVGRGERLLEVVPAEVALLVKARLKAADGVDVGAGMRAEMRVLTAHSRTLPLIHGVVRTRSADARPDPATSALFYDIEVVINPGELKAIDNLRLLPGTPIEVIVPTGSRTVLRYLLEPISESFRRGMREK
jgi:HlyD family secretion protein